MSKGEAFTFLVLGGLAVFAIVAEIGKMLTWIKWGFG